MSVRYRPKTKGDDKSPLLLQETVIIGYADIAAAGCRAMLGVSGTNTEIPFDVPGISTPPCCSRADHNESSCQSDLKPFVIYQCSYMVVKGMKKCKYGFFPSPFDYSFIIINTHIPSKISHRLAKFITDLCSHSNVRRIMILSALRLDFVEGPIRRMYENVWNGMGPVTSCHSLPSDLKFCDAFLSNLMQMLLIEGIAFSCLFCPANKAETGQANDDDGSLEVIATMQEYIGDITLLGFSLNKSKSLTYKGNPEENADMVAMIYV